MTDCRFETLDERMRTLLPPLYQETYEDVQPVSMGSAGLIVDAQGRVAWDRIWGSFCDLAMAGGPPHRGTLLGPGDPSSIDADLPGYEQVVSEICRGIIMTTGLGAEPSRHPGWLRVDCDDAGAANWLVRAITMENVSVRLEGQALLLPAAPDYRLEKEIKNVVTVVAKTHHYWDGHMGRLQRRAIGALCDDLEETAPLVTPRVGYPEADAQAVSRLATRVTAATGLVPSATTYQGWMGFTCAGVRAAVWMMRLLLAVNVLARREGAVLFVPSGRPDDPRTDERIVDAVSCVCRLAASRQVA